MKTMVRGMEKSDSRNRIMTGKKRWIGFVVGAFVLGAGWYLFRPELLFVNKKVNEALPGAIATGDDTSKAPRVVATGSFHNGAHDTKGMATIHQAGDAKRILRLTNFETSNGPDVRVFLVAAKDATDNDMVKKAGYIDLGSLKGNMGDQNYDIPADIDLEKYQAVTIWCNRFGVNFGTAPLTMSAVADDMMAGMSPQPLKTGMFHNGAHETKGTATIFQLADTQRVLRLTDFETSNGPDVHVFLVAANDATDNDSVKQAGYVDLGSIKGNIGDQNYNIPADVDLNKYQAVTIWCNRFGVNFGTAPLN